MKIGILESPAFVLLVVASLVITVGLWGLSFSSYDKGDDSVPFLFILSMCVIGLGIVAAFISLVVGLVAAFDRWFSHSKHPT